MTSSTLSVFFGCPAATEHVVFVLVFVLEANADTCPRKKITIKERQLVIFPVSDSSHHTVHLVWLEGGTATVLCADSLRPTRKRAKARYPSVPSVTEAIMLDLQELVKEILPRTTVETKVLQSAEQTNGF